MPGMMEKGPELLGKNRSANGSAKSPAGGGGSGASSTNGGLHYSEPESGCSSDDEHGGSLELLPASPPAPLPLPLPQPPPLAALPPSLPSEPGRCGSLELPVQCSSTPATPVPPPSTNPPPLPPPPRPHPLPSPGVPRVNIFPSTRRFFPPSRDFYFLLSVSSFFFSPFLFFYIFFWHCFADVGMRVGAEYQARIPEFDPGRYICLSKILSSLSWAWFGVDGLGVQAWGREGMWAWAGQTSVAGRLSGLAGL